MFESITNAVIDAAVQALGGGAQIVEKRAKQLAPVRNIFGDEYHFRSKTPRELASDARILTLSLGAAGLPRFAASSREVGEFGTVVTGKRPPRRWSERRASAAYSHLGDYDQEMAQRKLGKDPEPTMLTRQGAYEVRSKRADFSTWGHTHVGGRLRGEIATLAPHREGSMAEAWVISPTEYAKYQEFGTRHNRAHPFLRPAAEESRDAVVQAIAAAVKEASRQGGADVAIEVVVRL